MAAARDSRCSWCLGSSSYIAYHDDEWGRPVHDERVFYEFLTLEGALVDDHIVGCPAKPQGA